MWWALGVELEPTIKRLHAAGIRVSLFVDPTLEQVDAAAELGVDMVELHTGRLANAFAEKIQNQELQNLQAAAKCAAEQDLQVNAGHGINYTNIELIHTIPHLTELNIGHSIVSRALFVGIEAAVREMLTAMADYRKDGSAWNWRRSGRVRANSTFARSLRRPLSSHRVFTDGEIEYSTSMKFPARHLAARFAAKEAVSKAFGTGIGKAMGWRDIDVQKKPSGEPFLVLTGGAEKLAEDRRSVQGANHGSSHTESSTPWRPSCWRGKQGNPLGRTGSACRAVAPLQRGEGWCRPK